MKLADGMTTVAEYEFDGLNRRIVKNIYNGGSLDHKQRSYYSESWQVLETRKEVGGTEDPDPLEQHVWHPYYIDALLLRDYDPEADGTSVRHYFTHDANFNVTAVTDDGGTVVERYAYQPYGELLVLDADFSLDANGQSDIANRFTFTGREHDPQSGLYDFRARIYHAELGVFISRDSYGYVNGASLYGAYFVPNSVDPSGHVAPLVVCGGALGVIALWNLAFPDAVAAPADDLDIMQAAAITYSNRQTRTAGTVLTLSAPIGVQAVPVVSRAAVAYGNAYAPGAMQFAGLPLVQSTAIGAGYGYLGSNGDPYAAAAGGLFGAGTALPYYYRYPSLAPPPNSRGGPSPTPRIGPDSILSAPKSGVPTIGGRVPINSKYAGQTHPSGIKFTEQGFPDFSPVSKAQVQIKGLTGNYTKDAALANQAVGLKATPSGYVWHHVEDGVTMQLVPQSIHNATRHTGGAAVIRNEGCDP